MIDEYGIDYVESFARFRGKGHIEVNDKIYKYTRAAIIAVGAKAWKLPINGLVNAGEHLLDNEELFTVKPNINSIAIIGGRAQAVEIAQIMARSSVKTYVLQRSNKLSPTEEPEIIKAVEEVLVNDGVEVYTSTNINLVKKSSDGVKVLFVSHGKNMAIDTKYIYLATGRKPQLDGMGLEEVGAVTSRKGYIVVDKYLRAADKVYAAGDCINGYMLEPVAAR